MARPALASDWPKHRSDGVRGAAHRSASRAVDVAARLVEARPSSRLTCGIPCLGNNEGIAIRSLFFAGRAGGFLPLGRKTRRPRPFRRALCAAARAVAARLLWKTLRRGEPASKSHCRNSHMDGVVSRAAAAASLGFRSLHSCFASSIGSKRIGSTPRIQCAVFEQIGEKSNLTIEAVQ